MSLNNIATESTSNIFKWLLATLIIFSFHAFLYYNWANSYGDIFIDSSREVTVPMRILAGQTLYADFHYEYGPFIPYFFSTLTYWLGDNLEVYRLTGLIVSLLVSVFLMYLCQQYIHKAYALLSTLVFIGLFSFHSAYINIFNFIFPYSFAATFGILFLFIMYVSGLHYLREKGFISLIILFTSFIVCLFLKLEITLAACVYIVALISCQLLENLSASGASLLKENKRVFIVSLFVGSFIIAGLFFYIFWQPEMVDEIMFLVKKNLNNHVGRLALGLEDAGYNLIAFTKALAFILSSIFLFVLLERTPSKSTRYLLFSAVILAGISFLLSFGFNLLYRCTLFFLVGFSFFLYIKIKRHGFQSASGNDKAMLCLVLSSLTLTLRMFFNNTVDFYGFYILVPTHACLFIFLFHYLPNIIKDRFHINTPLLKTGFSIYFIVTLIMALLNSHYYAYKKRFPLVTDKGIFNTYQHEYIAVQSFLNEFKQKLNKDDTLLVLPEGYLLSYFLNTTPSSYLNSHIPDLSADADREQEIIRDIQIKKFDYVVIVPRYTPEFGMNVLGRDYMNNVIGYINQHYQPYLLYGNMPFSNPGEFGIFTMSRKE